MPVSLPAPAHAACRALFITPNPMMKRDLLPLLARGLPGLVCSEVAPPQDPSAVASVLRAETPDLCLIDFGQQRDPDLSLLPQLLEANPRLVVVALLSSSDPDLVLRALRKGAADFLLNPFSQQQVDAMLEKIVKLLPAAKVMHKQAAVHCVMPVKGSCGATTVACNLAQQWKRHGSKRILLADLDSIAGTLPFVLKVKSQYSFLDVLHRSSDIDADLWNAMVAKHNGIDVLLSPENMVEGAAELADPGAIVEYARYNYDIVLLDTDGVYGPWNLAIAGLSDDVLLISTNELSALQAAQRALRYLEHNGVGRWKIRVIINRYLREVGLTEEVIGAALNADIYHCLPSDYEAVQKALMDGKAVPPSTALGKSLARLADRMAGREESLRKSPSFAGILSLFSRTSS